MTDEGTDPIETGAKLLIGVSILGLAYSALQPVAVGGTSISDLAGVITMATALIAVGGVAFIYKIRSAGRR